MYGKARIIRDGRVWGKRYLEQGRAAGSIGLVEAEAGLRGQNAALLGRARQADDAKRNLGVPAGHGQERFTAPDSRIMKDAACRACPPRS